MSNSAKGYNQTGEASGTVELNPKIFGVEKIRTELVHEVVTLLLGNQRNTVASSKTKGLVRGGGKKPWQQKGTGRARHGSSRSPIWKGGGDPRAAQRQGLHAHHPEKDARACSLHGALPQMEGR